MERFKDGKIRKIKNEILGKKYELSVAFISKSRSKFLNNKYRKINKATDVLSFNLSPSMGEILICPEVSKIDPLFLVIHAMLHLKGMEHSSKMEAYELAYYSRYRHRHL